MAQTTYIPRKGQDLDAKTITCDALTVNGIDVQFGEKFYLDPVNGSDSNDGTSWSAAKLTWAAAKALLTTNKNQVLYYIAGATGVDLSAAVDWSFSHTHLIAIGAPIHVGQRARFSQAAGDLNLSPMFKVSGNGCIFKGLRFFQGTDDAQSLICFQITGQRNYFENCHFSGAGHATNAIDGAASLNIVGGASGGGSENRFVDCTIGGDTIAAATGVDALLISGTGAARNEFKDCEFALWASNGGAAMVEMSAIDSIDRSMWFKECDFINLGTAIDSGFVIPAGFDPANKRFLLRNCTKVGVTKWDANDRGAVYGNMDAVTGADGSGGLVQVIS